MMMQDRIQWGKSELAAKGRQGDGRGLLELKAWQPATPNMIAP